MTTNNGPLDVSELRVKALAATQGDWIASEYMDDGRFGVLTKGNTIVIGAASRTTRANAEYIAAANPQAVLALLDDYERMQEALREIAGHSKARRVHELQSIARQALEGRV